MQARKFARSAAAATFVALALPAVVALSVRQGPTTAPLSGPWEPNCRRRDLGPKCRLPVRSTFVPPIDSRSFGRRSPKVR